tara:strand:+ start:588 stop:743 length:156 start_codon:yes stop_codon:yes gene_type:complete
MIAFLLAIKILEINPSALPLTHFDNVVAVKGAIKRMSAHSHKSICKGLDLL